jgi:hypothetical protein
VVSEKSIWQRITNDRKRLLMCSRVVKTNNPFFSFFFANKRFDRISKQ